MSNTRTAVEDFIAYIEDELCKRMDIDDFNTFFTDLATELFRRYGPSVPADFGDNCLTCGLYIESCKEKPAPTRPEEVREAMENADIIAKMPIGERDSLDDNLVDFAAYVRELEDERERLQSALAEARKGRG